MEFKENVTAAFKRINDFVRKTPLEYSHILSKMCSGMAYLKLESEQIGGSFKIRGAYNKLKLLCEESKIYGAVTASTGNHAIASTFAGSKLGIPVTIYAPETISKAKMDRVKLLGGNITVYGKDCIEAEAQARSASLEKNLPYISPYNDMDVVFGQGTLGLEIYDDLENVDYVLVPVGGGGLIGGIAGYLKTVNSSIQIIGCQPENSKVMYESIKAGKIIYEESLDTLSDATAGGIEDDSITFELCQRFVDEWIIVTEEEIEKAIYFMIENHSKIIEGGAGVSVGAFLKDPRKYKDKNVVILCEGCNIAINQIQMIINKYSK